MLQTKEGGHKSSECKYENDRNYGYIMMLMAVADNIRWLSSLYKYNMSTGGKCKYYSDTVI